MPEIRSGLRVHGGFSFLSCFLATKSKRKALEIWPHSAGCFCRQKQRRNLLL
jgi:hypothetical protein